MRAKLTSSSSWLQARAALFSQVSFLSPETFSDWQLIWITAASAANSNGGHLAVCRPLAMKWQSAARRRRGRRPQGSGGESKSRRRRPLTNRRCRLSSGHLQRLDVGPSPIVFSIVVWLRRRRRRRRGPPTVCCAQTDCSVCRIDYATKFAQFKAIEHSTETGELLSCCILVIMIIVGRCQCRPINVMMLTMRFCAPD